MARPIVFLTDFGTRDPYAGVLELVVARHAPAARVIHLSHGVPPQRVDVASFVVAKLARELPDDAVMCVVVDPGVGTDRFAVALEATLELDQGPQRLTFVGPDNGLLTELLPGLRDVRVARLEHPTLERPRHREPSLSATFHGRDIFAPAAAHLALGADVASFGPALDPGDLALLDLPQPRRTAAGWDATVRYVDHFGDLVTDLPATDLAADFWRVHARDERLGDVAPTFGSVAPGEGVAYVGSWGTLEVAVRDGSAAERWGLDVGDQVQVLQTEPPD